MEIKKITIGLVLIIASSISAHAQDYFVVKKDTTFCSNLKYSTTAQGYLKSIKYTDINRKEISIDGRKNVPDVETFYIDSILIDKTPLKANKPDSYIRYTKRVVDGKLKVHLAQQRYNTTMKYTPGSPHGDFSTFGPTVTGIYRFFLKMPDGTYYNIKSKSDMKKHIKPYLLKCVAFKNQYKGDFSTREEPFMDMIKLYNSICE